MTVDAATLGKLLDECDLVVGIGDVHHVWPYYDYCSAIIIECQTVLVFLVLEQEFVRPPGRVFDI